MFIGKVCNRMRNGTFSLIFIGRVYMRNGIYHLLFIDRVYIRMRNGTYPLMFIVGYIALWGMGLAHYCSPIGYVTV